MHFRKKLLKFSDGFSLMVHFPYELLIKKTTFLTQLTHYRVNSFGHFKHNLIWKRRALSFVCTFSFPLSTSLAVAHKFYSNVKLSLSSRNITQMYLACESGGIAYIGSMVNWSKMETAGP